MKTLRNDFYEKKNQYPGIIDRSHCNSYLWRATPTLKNIVFNNEIYFIWNTQTRSALTLLVVMFLTP